MGRNLNRLVKSVNTAIKLVKIHGEIHYAYLALKVGYSPDYFRRTLVPLMKEMEDGCIKLEHGGLIKWTCSHDEDLERDLRAEARGELERLGVAG